MVRNYVFALVFGLMTSAYIGNILADQFEGLMVESQSGNSADYNATIEAVITYTWITFDFLVLEIILICGARAQMKLVDPY